MNLWRNHFFFSHNTTITSPITVWLSLENRCNVTNQNLRVDRVSRDYMIAPAPLLQLSVSTDKHAGRYRRKEKKMNSVDCVISSKRPPQSHNKPASKRLVITTERQTMWLEWIKYIGPIQLVVYTKRPSVSVRKGVLCVGKRVGCYYWNVAVG